MPWKVGVSQTPLAKAVQRACHVVIKKQLPFFAKVCHAHRKETWHLKEEMLNTERAKGRLHEDKDELVPEVKVWLQSGFM